MPCTGRFASGASLAGFAPVKAVDKRRWHRREHSPKDTAGLGREFDQ
jgi:hypothetical protein